MSFASDVIGAFATGDYLVTRHASGTIVNGRYAPGAASTLQTGISSVQPVKGRDLLALPDGLRAEDTRLILTTTFLVSAEVSNDPDVITYKNEPWVLHTLETWDAFGETWYRGWMSRQVISEVVS